MATSSSVLGDLVTEAIRRGADSLEVEYKGGSEVVFACRGGVGVSIANFRSTGREAGALRRELMAVLRGRRHVIVSGTRYELQCTVYDSFGEDAFEVSLQRAVARCRLHPGRYSAP